MFIPIGTEIDSRRPPVVTMALIAANFIVAILVLMAAKSGGRTLEELVTAYAIRRDGFRPWQLLTSMFMHDLSGVMHLLGNMLFLWVFGGAVEQRLGRLPFLAFYLLGGAFAGLGHILASPAPAIGASGAVAAVLGAYLVLFPLANVRVVFFLFIWGLGTIPAWWVICLYFALDVASQIADFLGAGGRNVAYMAHIAGNVFGFGVALLLLKARLVHRSQTDLLYLIKQAARRRAMRQTADGGAVWHGDIPHKDRLARNAGSPPPPPPPAAGRSTHARGTPPPPPSRLSADEHATRRGEIVTMLGSGDKAGAVAAYRALLVDSPGTALPPAQQLELANRLMAEDAVAEAAGAYELFLLTAPPGPDADEVRLILGLIYVRRQPDPARARPLLEQARPRLRDARRALADELLAELAT